MAVQSRILRVLNSAYLVVKKRGITTQWLLLQCYIPNLDVPPPMLLVMVSYNVSPHGLIIWSLYSVNQFFHRSIHFNLTDYPTKHFVIFVTFVIFYILEASSFILSLHFQGFCYHLAFIILGTLAKIPSFSSNAFKLCFPGYIANRLSAQSSHAYLLGLGPLNVSFHKATMN